MTFGSLFAGIGGFDLGFENAGMTCVAQVEIDPVCRSVLSRHFDAQQETDVVRYRYGWEPKYAERFTTRFVRPDVLCGGFPCQDLSVAGKRAGLDGNRSGLWFTFRRIIARVRPRWVCIENVPGLLSSNDGRDMGIVLAGLADLGYGWAYRVLDAQWFRVAQRRRRVFIVGCLGDRTRAARVLFEPARLPWDSPTRSEAESFASPEVAASLAGSRRVRHGRSVVSAVDRHMGAGGVDDNAAQAGHLVAETFCPPISPCLKARDCKGPSSDGDGDGDGAPLIAHTLRAEGFDASEDGTGRGTPIVPVAYQCHGSNVGPMGTLRAGNGNECGGVPFMVDRMAVRRLTPRECERLQGFPDDWTRFAADGSEISNSARYRMLGNAVNVKCSEWIGRRLYEQEARRRA